MRFEAQWYPRLVATLEQISAGSPVTGSTTAVCIIFRVADSKYYNGTTWQSGSSTLSLTESATFSGLYIRTVPAAHLDYTLGKSGYIIRVGDPTYNVLQTVQVSQPQGLDEALTDHLGTGTAGEAILRILGLRGHNSRVKYTAWNSAGVPSAATVWVYASKAALDADTGSTGSGSVAEYTVTASFDTSLRPTVYKSGKVT
jgi:hypothetical protein